MFASKWRAQSLRQLAQNKRKPIREALAITFTKIDNFHLRMRTFSAVLLRLAPIPFLLLSAAPLFPGTVALWLFDEQKNVYPSSVLSDATEHNYFVVIGRGARIVDGKFGRALEPVPPAPLEISRSATQSTDADETGSAARFGLVQLPNGPGRKTAPMSWMNANFAGLMTCGEAHLRKPEFANTTDTHLNLGAFDWTVEFWYKPLHKTDVEGTVFEIGQGPRGENDFITRLAVDTDANGFVLLNQPSGTRTVIPTAAQALDYAHPNWHHFAFVYSARNQELRHYADGAAQGRPLRLTVAPLPHGDEAYFSIGRDGAWGRALPGVIDELRISNHQVYTAPFEPPGSFSGNHGTTAPAVLQAGLPLLFDKTKPNSTALHLGSRKHLFIDDALIADSRNIRFTPHPPRRTGMVLDELRGHMSVVEDESGLLRIYYQGPNDSLAVLTSRDGIHWVKPDLGWEYQGQRNVAIPLPVGLGTVFIDPNAPRESRWKYVSGIRRQGIYVFSSKDGYAWQRFETAALPFSAGSQSAVYYDDQRQVYTALHRSDYGETPGGATRRRFIRSEVKEIYGPWPFESMSAANAVEISKTLHTHVHKLNPWFLDNGPLTPCGPGAEFPTAIDHEPFDPPGTDIYSTKAMKYLWAPDAYVAFPSVYFHYRADGPPARQILGSKQRERGSGTTEVQLAVSRDGRNWTRYPRPVYAGLESDGADALHMQFMVAGMVRRGNEIWQYVTGHTGGGVGYHSPVVKGAKSPVWRMVQRLDGFVAAEAPYEGGTFTTKPLTFDGSRLRLNINTDATGYAQVGFLDANGNPIPGFSIDDCVYINGDFIDTPAEWLHHGSEVSSLRNRTVRLVFRMRGAQLFAMQFTDK
jgi:hypothetical protein